MWDQQRGLQEGCLRREARIGAAITYNHDISVLFAIPMSF